MNSKSHTNKTQVSHFSNTWGTTDLIFEFEINQKWKQNEKRAC